MLIDTHIHLDAAEFDPDREAVIAAARAAGVGRFVVPGVEVANFDKVAALSDAHGDIVHAFGIHPLYVAGACTDDLDVLQERLANGRAVAVGEIGLDFYAENFDRATQEQYFVEQLKLARRFGLPVILHVRRAVDDILKHLRRIEVPGGIAHAFNGSRQQADAFIALGFRLGFGGAMTFDGSRRIRNLAATLPLDSIVLETDAPDIPPAWAQGGRNEPADLRRFAEVLAGLRGLSVAEIAEATGRNACAVLPALARG
ncbi:TatD family hydrolase [Aromatoleum evansii]|uniref:TatD family hydrolase n=1 Tax=Aromatoleum evansii TaxID=59406 RepID=A0ABZ1AG20_AROEV|nr:TatD family hydrolase [Aromatoleum evansii]NMG27688.1 TatD family deoxyribonuclease [Aromatoleum evansii]WRL44450.1 TatD family hydrolase [Aromatoleum evansii]